MTAARTILLIEDDPDQASLFAEALAITGYTVVTVSDVEQAIAKLREQHFDMALIDWDLPGMKGDAFIFLLKTEYPEIRTMLFSNHTNVAEAASISGADAWMMKTDGILRLREMVADLLQVR